MKKEIKFSAKLDSADFDRTAAQMERKLRDLYAPANNMIQQNQWASRMEGMGIGGGTSKPSQEAFNRATQQSRASIDQNLTTEVKRQLELNKSIDARIEKAKKLKALQDATLKGSEDELKIAERIARVEGNTARLKEIERARAESINKIMDVRESMTPKGADRIREAWQQGGIGKAASTGVDMLKSMGPGGIASLVGGALVAAGAAARIGGDLYAGFKNAPVNTASSYGSAMKGVLGGAVGSAYSGNSAIEMAFMPERNKAMAMAREAMKGERVRNAIGLATSPLDGMMSAGGKGALAGAAIGSIVPGLGTAAGGLVGGALGIGYNAVTNISGNSKMRALALSGVSDTHNQEYEGMMAKDFASKYDQAYQGLKDQNPLKTAAAEQYQGNYMRYLDTQRSMGLSDKQFNGAGGYRMSAIDAGFTDDMAMGASGAILGAGGSTSMAQDSTFALKAARQFNQTNASGVLGQLSGSLGDSESSKQAYIKMFAEGTRQGFDSTQYAEESRKFMEVQASVISKSGVTGDGDIDRIVSQLGGFMADKTNKGIQSAKEAFDFYNQASSETGGPRGIMRAAGMMKDKDLSKMDAFTRAGVAGISPDQMSETDPAIVYAAGKAGLSPKDFISKMQDVNKGSFNFRKSTDDAMKRTQNLQNYMSGMDKNDPEYAAMQSQLDDASGEFNIGLATDNPNMSPRQRQALAKGLTANSPDERTKAMAEAAAISKSEDKVTGRQGDEAVSGAAESSRMVLESFNKFSKELTSSPETIRQFNQELVRAVEALQKLSGADRAKAMSQLQFSTPKTQTQGERSSGN